MKKKAIKTNKKNLLWFIKENIFLAIVFLLFTSLRFYQLDKKIILDWDQEQFSNQIWDIVVNHKLTLLGPRVTDVRGFFLAPYLTYLLVPFYLLTKLHPIALMYFLLFWNLLFFGFAFYSIKKNFSSKTALIFLFFWSTNFFHLDQDVIPWWPVTIPLGTLVVWHILSQIKTKDRFWLWGALGLTLGFFVNMHFQFMLIGLFAVLYLLLNFYETKKIPVFKIGFSIVTFLIMFTPLLIFDLRHQFLNSQLFLNYFLKPSGEKPISFIKGWPEVLENFLLPYLQIKSLALTGLFFLLIALTNIYLIKNKKTRDRLFFQASLIFWLFLPIIFTKYGRRPSEYYFLIYAPLIQITLAEFLSTKKNWLVFFVLGSFIFFNLKHFFVYGYGTAHGLYAKEQVVLRVKTLVGDRPFNTAFDGPPNTDTGFRYLMRYYKLNVVETPAPMVGINQPDRVGDWPIGKYGINLPKVYWPKNK